MKMKLSIFINFSFLLAFAISASGEDLTQMVETSTGSSAQEPPMSEADTPNEEECTASNLFREKKISSENEPDDEKRYAKMAFEDLYKSQVYSRLLNFEVRFKDLNLALAYTPSQFAYKLMSLETEMSIACDGFGTDASESSKQFQRSFASIYMSVSHLIERQRSGRTDTCPTYLQNRLECLQQFGKTEREMMKWLQEDTNSENSNLVPVPRPVVNGTKGANEIYKNIYDYTKRRLTTSWMEHNLVRDVNTSVQVIYKSVEPPSEYIRRLSFHRDHLFDQQNSFSLATVKDSLVFEPDLINAFMVPFIKLYMKVSYALENYLLSKDLIGGDLNYTLAQRCNFLENFRTGSNETMIWALEQREEVIEDYYTIDIHKKREQDKKIIQDHLFNPIDVFLKNSSGSNFCKELKPLGNFTDDKSDVTFDIYGRKCIKPCTDYGRYWYCYYSDSDWHYCSPKGKTKKGETCKSQCTQGQNTAYYWCSTDSSWNTCSPYL